MECGDSGLELLILTFVCLQKTFSDRDVYECCDMSFSRSTGSDELQRFMVRLVFHYFIIIFIN